MKGKSVLLISFCFLTYISYSQIFIDKRDGKSYQTIKIGDQIWMAENLAYKVSDSCWAYNNDSMNVKKYGYLYTWNVAKKVCPPEWKLPTKTDFEKLLKEVGTDDHKTFMALKQNGRSGFKALFAGRRDYNGNYSLINQMTFFWTSNIYDYKNAYRLLISTFGRKAYIDSQNRKSAHSVRCIKTLK